MKPSSGCTRKGGRTGELLSNFCIRSALSRNLPSSDIKPQNLLLQSSGHLLLTDFGSAAPLSPGSSSAIARKYCRALVGTPDYIAPEVLEHAEKVFEENEAEEEDEFDEGEGTKVDPEEGAYGAEVDVWACGVVMYEVRWLYPLVCRSLLTLLVLQLLTGKAPFFAEENSDTYERIRNYSVRISVYIHAPDETDESVCRIS